MCGIAGYAGNVVRNEAEGSALVGRMCDTIRHRGPDDEGRFVEEGVGLGMRRLSIIDLSTGHQPMLNEDGTVVVVFNGEIYNFRELRATLERHGHRFASESDTETIVHAYEQWGEDAIARLRGMFAIAIWDRRARTLILARDRAGIKPLYFSASNGSLVFGSELKALLASGLIERQVDLEALDHYLSFLYTPPDGSIFQGMRKLRPGHLLVWRSGASSVRQYWRLSGLESFRGTEAEAAEALRAVLADAVRSHMISDVPLGAFLSGGIDSSLVVGLMAQASDRPVKTFSIGFDEPAYDELQHARTVAERFGTDHHEHVVRPNALDIVERLVEHFDEPFGDSSAIPTWYVSEIARTHVTVALSGDGGDELFGGYDRYLPSPRVAAFDRLALPGIRGLAGLAWPRLPAGARGRRFLRHVSLDERHRYLDALTFFHADDKRRLYTSDIATLLDGYDAEAGLSSHFRQEAVVGWPTRMMAFDFETYLPEDILTKVDRTSMAHSLESRVPLLDNEVVAFAASLPSAFKIDGGLRKRVLKQAVSDLLPASILTRRKQGFGVPVGLWFRGALREAFADVLGSRACRERGYFRRPVVDRLVREHVSGRRDHSERLWLLYMLELWHRRYLDAPISSGNRPAVSIRHGGAAPRPDRSPAAAAGSR